jgi:N-acetyl-anhydromuramyl-L-alanine amidase AmpD
MLRTDLFKTMARGNTRVIAVRDTLTPPSDETDAYTIDTQHCRQGRLGIGYHFLVVNKGDIQLCRDIETVGSHTRNLDDISVAIGVTGGVDKEGQRTFTRNPDQIEAIDDLIAFLSQRYPEAEVNDRPLGQ